MHRKPKAKLLPLDTKIERTLKNLRRITSEESRNMANQRERLQSIPEKKKNKKNRDFKGLILWRNFGDLLFKRSTLQWDILS